MSATEYTILRNTPGDLWEVQESVRASSADQAIRAHAEAADLDDDAMFVAVPARSWNPRKVRVEVQTRIRFGEETNG